MPRFRLFCALGVFLLGFAASAQAAATVFPPSEDTYCDGKAGSLTWKKGDDAVRCRELPAVAGVVTSDGLGNLKKADSSALVSLTTRANPSGPHENR